MWPRKSHPETESVKALEDARKRLEETQSRTPRVMEVSRSLLMIREKNGFAEDLKTLMGGSH